ncbi:50S ribosomal protein L31 [bacterium]|nr:50S ribosomal protein L31 [Candidatus Omnitrophota bacterium]MBU3929333.1 50S ribosomal protein L31 [bacterium]MBU4122448.1 50S ribosomal protein L31 [bacterium]
MKDKIHPDYKPVKVICTCGNTFEVRSTMGTDIRLEICSACHPFFTGKQKLIDSVGSLSKFEKRYKKTAGQTVRVKPKKAVKKKTAVKKTKLAPKKKISPDEE